MVPMALALALAAFLGAALGVVWHSVGFGADDRAEKPAKDG